MLSYIIGKANHIEKPELKEVLALIFNEKIQVVAHNPQWKQQYIDEVSLLKQAPCLSTLAYEHIGSTAIPNIKAKPIIDIIIGVNNFPPRKEIIEEIQESGYTYMQEMSVPDRLYFITRGQRNFNVHVIAFKGSVWNNDVLFRNYMINHFEKAQEYSDLKEDPHPSSPQPLYHIQPNQILHGTGDLARSAVL